MAKLGSHAQAIKAMGATSLYLFGSTGRDEATVISDLDLFIDYDPNTLLSGSLRAILQDRLAA